MASSLAFKRLASSSSTRFFKLLNPPAVGSIIPSSFSSASVRSFKTTFNFLDDEGNLVFKASKCPDSDEIEGFDVRTNERFLKTSRGIERVMSGEGYEIRQDSEGLNLILKMSGFEKEDVKISVENGRFIIKAAAKKSEDNEFCLGLDMPPPYVYNHDKMKAEMKNGVLKIVFPRLERDIKLALGSQDQA